MARKPPKLATLRKRAWNACSQSIRQKAAKNGQVKCVSCSTWNTIQETDAGHFIPRSRSGATYFLEENIHPQCQRCNRFDPELAKIGYTQWMIDYYGPEMVKALQELSRETVRYRAADYLEIEAHFSHGEALSESNPMRLMELKLAALLNDLADGPA